MSNVDQRIVQMTFDNKEFERNVATSMSTLDKLKAALNFEGSSQSLKSLEKAAGDVNLSGLSKNVDFLADRFSNMGVVSMEVLRRITNAAIDAGKKMVDTVLAPIKSGGWNRAMNIEQAKFQIEGLGKSWETVKEDVLYGVKDTAYGLDAAARVASQLIASNVELGDTMKGALRGVSGVAAMTNSSYEDIGRIFTTVAGQGRLMGDQLMQLSTRGLNVAATLGKALNKSEAEIREMVSHGEIDFNTFAKAMDDAFGEHATKANDTFTGSLSNMKAALSRIGADFATPMLENGRKIFNTLTPIIDTIHEKLGPVIKDVSEFMGDATTFITDRLKGLNFDWLDSFAKGFHHVYTLLRNVILSVKDGWEKMFPPSAQAIVKSITDSFGNIGKVISDVSDKVESFLAPYEETLKELGLISEETAETSSDLDAIAKRVMSGEFGDGEKRRKELEKLDYVYEIVQNRVNELSGSTYRYAVTEEQAAKMAAKLGDKSIKATDQNEELAKKFVAGIRTIFGVSSEETEKSVDETRHSIERLSNVFGGVFAAFDILSNTVSSIVTGAFSPVVDILLYLGDTLLDVGSAIGVWLMDFDSMLKQTGAYEKLANGVNSAMTSLYEILKTVGGVLNSVWENAVIIITGAKQAWEDFKNSFKQTAGFTKLKTIFDGIGTALSNFKKNVLDTITDRLDKFSKWRITLPTFDATAFGKSVGDKVEWLIDKVTLLKNQLTNLFVRDENGNAIGFLAKFGDQLSIVKESVGAFFDSFISTTGPEIFNGFISGIQSGIGSIGDFVNGIKDSSQFKAFADGLSNAAAAVGGFAGSFASGFYDKFTAFKELISVIKENIKNFFSAFTEEGANKFELFIGLIRNNVSAVRDFLSPIKESIVTTIKDFFTMIADHIPTLEHLTDALLKLKNDVASGISNVWEFVVDLFTGNTRRMAVRASASGSSITKAFTKGLVSVKFKGVFKTLSSVFEGFLKILSSVKDKVIDFVGLFSKSGAEKLRGFVDLISKNAKAMKDFFEPIKDRTVSSIGKFFDILKSRMPSLNDFISALGSLKQKVSGSFENVGTIIGKLFTSGGGLATAAFEQGKQLIEPFIEGLKSFDFSSLADRFSSFTEILINAKGRVLEFLHAFKDNASTMFGTFVEKIASAKSGIGEFVSNFKDEAIEKVKAFLELLGGSKEKIDTFINGLKMEGEGNNPINFFIELIGKAKESVEKFFQEFSSDETNPLGTFSLILKTASDNIYAFIQNFKQDAIDKIASFKELIQKIKENCVKLFSAFSSGNTDKITTFTSFLSENLEVVKKFFAPFKQSVANAASNLFNAISDGLPTIGTLGEAFDGLKKKAGDILDKLYSLATGTIGTAKDIFDRAFNSAKNIVLGFVEGLNSIDMGQIGKIVKDGSLAALLLGIIDLVWGIGQLSRRWSLVGKGMYKEMKAAAFQTNSEAIRNIADAILVIALAMTQLSNVPGEKLAGVTIAIDSILGTITALVRTVKSNQNVEKTITGPLNILATGVSAAIQKFTKVASLVVAFAGLGAGIYLLVSAAEQLKLINYEDIVYGIGKMATILAVLGGIEVLFTKYGSSDWKFGVGFAALAGAMLMISYALERLKDLTWKENLEGFTMAIAGILGLAFALKIAGNVGAVSSIGMLALVGVMMALTYALQLLEGVSTDQLTNNLLKVFGVFISMAGMTAVFALLSKALEPLAPTMIVVAGAMALFAGALLMLEAGVAGAAKIAEGLEPLLAALKSIWDTIGGYVLEGLKNFATNWLLPALYNVFAWIVNLLPGLLSGLLEMAFLNLADLLEGIPMFEGVVDKLRQAAGDISTTFDDMKLEYAGFGENIFDQFNENAKKSAEGAAFTVGEVRKRISDAFHKEFDEKEVLGEFNTFTGQPEMITRSLVDRFTSGVNAALPEMYNIAYSNVTSVWKSFAQGTADQLTESKEPIKESAKENVGNAVGEGTAEGIKESTPQVEDAQKDQLETLITGFISGKTDINEATKETLDSIGATIDENGQLILDPANENMALLQDILSGNGDNADFGKAANALISQYGDDLAPGLSDLFNNLSLEESSADTAGANVANDFGTSVGTNMSGISSLIQGPLGSALLSAATGVDTDSSAQAIVSGLTTYLSGGEATGAVNSAMEALGGGGLGALNAILGIESPSKETYNSGVYCVEGFVNAFIDKTQYAEMGVRLFAFKMHQVIHEFIPKYGETAIAYINNIVEAIGSNQHRAVSAMGSMARDCVTRLDEYIDSFESAGRYLIDGFAGAIEDRAYRAAQAAAYVAREAYYAMTRELDINSPSKKGEYVGEMLDDGVSMGISDNEKLVSKSATSVGKTAVKSIKNQVLDARKAIQKTAKETGHSIGTVVSKNLWVDDKAITSKTDKAVKSMTSAASTLSKATANTMNTSPTISPVLETTELENGSKYVDDILSDGTTQTYDVGVSGYVDLTAISDSINEAVASVNSKIDQTNQKITEIYNMLETFNGPQNAMFLSLMYEMMGLYFPQFGTLPAEDQDMLTSSQQLSARMAMLAKRAR